MTNPALKTTTAAPPWTAPVHCPRRRRLNLVLAGVVLAAWLALGVFVVLRWPLVGEEAPAGDRMRTERVCYRDGTASLETVLPDGRRFAVSDGRCTYSGPGGAL